MTDGNMVYLLLNFLDFEFILFQVFSVIAVMVGENFSIAHEEKDAELPSLTVPFPLKTEKIPNILDLLWTGNENYFQFLETEKMMNKTENQKTSLRNYFQKWVFFI